MSDGSRAKLRFSTRVSAEATGEELTFARQLGVECLYTWVGEEQTGLDYLRRLKERADRAGLTLYNVGNMRLGKCDQIHLALPGRDARIAELKVFIRNLGRVGIHVTTFTWEPTNVWSSRQRGESRGASARMVDMAELEQRPYTHGRAYSREEIWDNFAYLMREIIPVAEDAGVRLALHPNDPPVPELGGIPCLIHSWADYQRAFEIADSPALGMEFCAGCWLEGGAAFGDVLAGIRELALGDRILLVHFRNVTAPLPYFVETFLDNGYMDMYQIMRALVEVGYPNTVTLDHSPKLGSGGEEASTAYAVGYMRALKERAEQELWGAR